MTVRGTVKNGKVLLHDPTAIPEGAEVEIRLAKRPKSAFKSKVLERKSVARAARNPTTLQVKFFEHAGVRYNLRRPLDFKVEKSKGRWVYSNDSLNLWGHGARSEEALKDLHENFAYLWKEIAEENDEHLDGKARAIKKRLVELRAVGE